MAVDDAPEQIVHELPFAVEIDVVVRHAAPHSPLRLTIPLS
jgi:hypothetical protein